MRYVLRFSGDQHGRLREHLFPGDDLEAAALVLCGRLNASDRHAFCTRRIVAIPYDQCERTRETVDWPTSFAMPLVEEAMKRQMAIIKIHSHPSGYEAFSARDDEADTSFFGSVCTMLEDEMPHASAVMLPDGRIFARAIDHKGHAQPVDVVAVAGDGIDFWHAEGGKFGLPAFVQRHASVWRRYS